MELAVSPIASPRLPAGIELLRRAIVLGCALCLAAAGPAIPALNL